jgi:hypothetical protein
MAVARVLFERAKDGFRTVRGELIRRMQTALLAKGSNPGEIDGIFGRETEAALKAWQATAGFPPTGLVSADVWRRLVGATVPPLRERCLQITGDFEGHGYGKVAGNFDGAGLTWGIIGFTLRSGTLLRVLAEVRAQHPALLVQAFGPLHDRLTKVLDGSHRAQEEWAEEISVGAGRYRVMPEWESAFATLGAFPDVQKIQSVAVDCFWTRAQRDARAFELKTERGLALCFDIAVQNGGIGEAEARQICRRLDGAPPAAELDRRIIIANVVAEASRARWVEDVRLRKRVLAQGEGVAHGMRYSTRGWGLDDVPIL